MSDTTLEGARARYLADLQLEHPMFSDQLSDIVRLLHSVLDTESPPIVSSLDAVRADYARRLRDSRRTVDEHVLELAKACNDLFAPTLGLTGVGIPSSAARDRRRYLVQSQ